LLGGVEVSRRNTVPEFAIKVPTPAEETSEMRVLEYSKTYTEENRQYGPSRDLS
jgi:hypothetical protein